MTFVSPLTSKHLSKKDIISSLFRVVQLSSLLFLGVYLSSCQSASSVSTTPPPLHLEADKTFTDRNYERALNLYVNGALFEAREQYSQAILEFQDAVRLLPNESAIHFALAKSYRALGKLESAQVHSNRAIQLDPSNKWFFELAGQIAFESQQFARAVEFFDAFSKKDPSNSNALYMLAAALTSDERYAEAIEVYDRYILFFGIELDVLYKKLLLQLELKRFNEAIVTVIEMRILDPENEEITYTLGDLYTKQGRFDDAIQLFKSLLQRNKRDIRAMVSLSEAYIQKKDWKNFDQLIGMIFSSPDLNSDDKLSIGQLYVERAGKDTTLLKPAEIALSRLQREFPKEWKSFWYLGIIYMESKLFDKAVEQFKQLVALNPLWPPAWENLGIAYLSKNDAPSAVKTFQSAIKKLPSSTARLKALLGLSLSQNNQDEEAAGVLLDAVKQPSQLDEPILFQSYTILGMTFDRLRKYAESEFYYEESLKLRPEDALVLNNLAYSLAERDQQLERALEMSRIAVEKDSTNGAYLDTYGWVFFKLGKYQEARVWIEKALASGRESAAVIEHLGDVFYKLGDKVRALEQWRKAFSLNENNPSLREKLNAHKDTP